MLCANKFRQPYMFSGIWIYERYRIGFKAFIVIYRYDEYRYDATFLLTFWDQFDLIQDI